MSSYTREEDFTEEKIDIFQLIDDMWKGAKRFGIVMILFAILLACFMYVRSRRSYVPVYSSSSTFTVSSDNQSAYGGSNYYNNITAKQMAKTFPYILTSGLLQKTVAADLGVDVVPGRIAAEVLGETNLFTIEVTCTDAEMSYKILQSVIKNYPVVAEYVIGKTKMELLDMTQVPEVASNPPNFKRSAAKGFLLGLAMDVALLLLYAVTRKTVHTEDDLKKELNVECICALPQISFKKRGKEFRKDISIYNKKMSSAFLESVRVLRARIEKEAKKKNLKSILVTSAAPGEGKSTIAANAAMALAMNGLKVVLVDCDLRNPSVREVLNMKDGKPGVYEFLEKQAELPEILQYHPEYKMYVIPGGKPCSNASEMIDTPRMQQLIEQLKEVVDYIILDTAPVGMLTDTAVLAEYVDSALFVVKQDYAKISDIMEGVNQLAQSNIYLAGCILNGAQNGITGYGYKNYRYYGRYNSSYGKTEE